MIDTILIAESAVALQMDETNYEQILTKLAGYLVAEGCVDPNYAQKIIDRERSYPTALQFENIAVAIPHGDASYVVHSSLAVGLCKNRPQFYAMEDPTLSMGVDVVVVLAVKNPEEHLSVLNNLMEMFVSPDNCKAVLAATSQEEVCRLFRQNLYK